MVNRTSTVILACTVLLPAAAAAEPLPFEKAVAMALVTNEDYLALETQEEQAAHLVGLARSTILPRLELTGVYTRYKDAVEFEFSEGESFELRPLEDWNAQATLTQPLFLGLREWRALEGSKVLHQASLKALHSGRQDVALAVALAFTACHVATAEAEVRAHALELAEAQYLVADSLARAGEATDLDIQRARAQVLAAQVAAVDTREAETLAYRRLSRLVGLPADERPVLGSLPAALTDQPAVETLRADALARRSELAAAAGRVRAAELTVKVEKGYWLPSLTATAQYYRQRALFPSQDWLSGSLNLTIPIYDGGATAARVAQARTDLRLAQLELSRLEKAIADQVDAAWAAFASRRATVAMVAAQKDAANEAYRQTEIRYREGEATSTDVLSAQDVLIAAELGHARARHQLALAAVTLARAAGLDLVAGPTEDTEE